MTAPDVTVVIPAYNPGLLLREAVASVMGQTYPDWHILIVDDGSTEELQDYLPKNLARDRVTIVRHPRNLGQAAAMNTALSQVTTPYLLQLDADDLLLPDAIRRLRGVLENAPSYVGLVTANVLMVFTDGTPPMLRKGAAFTDRYRLLLRNAALWPRFYRTAALRQIGGWPTDGPFEGRYLEDRRALYRLIEAFEFAWVNEVVYIYRRHGGNMTIQHAREHNAVARWLVGDCLARWGNRFRPVFVMKRGVLLLARLKPVRRAAARRPRSGPVRRGRRRPGPALRAWGRTRGGRRSRYLGRRRRAPAGRGLFRRARPPRSVLRRRTTKRARLRAGARRR